MPGHFEDGKAVMVDVTHKPSSDRSAVAEATVRLTPDVVTALENASDRPDSGGKGDAVAVAELAGIMAAKRTSDLIPLCHPLPLTHVSVRGARAGDLVTFTATCRTNAPTGVEMEALTAASVAALTLYDMLKAHGKGIVIERTRLLGKDGGKSGPWRA